jgi:importin subunit alpha-6/7
MSNIAAGSFEHKKLIFASEATPLLMHLLRTAQFDIRREAAYTLGNLCVVPAGSGNPPSIIVEHLVAIVDGGALPGFINLVRSADIESARLGLQFLELVRNLKFDLPKAFSHIFCLLAFSYHLKSNSFGR